MDNEQQRIYEALNEIVKKRGGARSELKELFPDELKNPYEDDGSLEYDKLYASIVAKIAEMIFDLKGLTNTEKLQAIKAVPESTINKVMKKLRDGWDINNEGKMAKYEEAAKVQEKVKKYRKQEQEKSDVKTLAAKDVNELRKLMKIYEDPKVLDYQNKIKDTRAIAAYEAPADIETVSKAIYGKGRKKINLSAAERKRRSDRMKQLHRQKKI